MALIYIVLMNIQPIIQVLMTIQSNKEVRTNKYPINPPNYVVYPP